MWNFFTTYAYQKVRIYAASRTSVIKRVIKRVIKLSIKTRVSARKFLSFSIKQTNFPKRLSLVTLDRPTHCPMGSRRGDPAANAAPLKIQKRRNQGKSGCINLAMCYIVSKLKKTQTGEENGKGEYNM